LGAVLLWQTAGAGVAQQKKDNKADDEKNAVEQGLELGRPPSAGWIKSRTWSRKAPTLNGADPAGNGKTAMVRAVMSG